MTKPHQNPFSRVPYRTPRYHPLNAKTLHTLKERRALLKNILVEQISIAETLSNTEGMESKATRWAWDVVEEVTRKLNRVEDTIFHTDDYDRTTRSVYDEELSRREYDL